MRNHSSTWTLTNEPNNSGKRPHAQLRPQGFAQHDRNAVRYRGYPRTPPPGYLRRGNAPALQYPRKPLAELQRRMPFHAAKGRPEAQDLISTSVPSTGRAKERLHHDHRNPSGRVLERHGPALCRQPHALARELGEDAGADAGASAGGG